MPMFCHSGLSIIFMYYAGLNAVGPNAKRQNEQWALVEQTTDKEVEYIKYICIRNLNSLANVRT